MRIKKCDIDTKEFRHYENVISLYKIILQSIDFATSVSQEIVLSKEDLSVIEKIRDQFEKEKTRDYIDLDELASLNKELAKVINKIKK